MVELIKTCISIGRYEICCEKKILVHLHVSTFTSFSCEITPYMDERNFWIFQAVTFTIFAVSYSLVRVRQKKLDGQLMDKINRQIASGI